MFITKYHNVFNIIILLGNTREITGDKGMKNIKNKKVVLGIIMTIILALTILVIYFITNKDEITFNEKLSKIEYGEQYEFKDMVKKLESKETKVKYPKVKASEIGTYEAVFQSEKNGTKREQSFKFEIVDTKKPKISLYVNKSDVEVSLNSEYNPTSNIKKFENVSDGVIGNILKVEKEEYSNLKKSIQSLNKQLKKQAFVVKGNKVTNAGKKAVKIVEENRNRIFYTTNLDTTKEGTYTFKLCVVDENFNVVEKTWNLKVVPKGNLLNSGGTVTCKYNGEELMVNEAVTGETVENYRYNPDKILVEYSVSAILSIKQEYQTKENMENLMNALNEQFASSMNEKGVTISITNNGYEVTTNMIVNMIEYNKKSDTLNILTKKKDMNVLMKSVLDNMDKTKYVCEVN